MSTATSSATSTHRVNAAVPQRTNAAPRSHAEPTRQLKMGTEEAAILNIDLAGLPVPKVGGLTVDGFKPSLFDRLFGKG